MAKRMKGGINIELRPGINGNICAFLSHEG